MFLYSLMRQSEYYYCLSSMSYPLVSIFLGFFLFAQFILVNARNNTL